jgi:hypothetical protein
VRITRPSIANVEAGRQNVGLRVAEVRREPAE